jgi:Flp pilus assembly protein TadG
MSARRTLRGYLADQTGAAAAEFALVSIVFLSMMMGTIDMARLMWELNSAKAATRAAARLAVVSEPVANELVDYDAMAAPLSLPAGSIVPSTENGGPPTVTCTSSGCSTGSLNTTAFNAIVARMQDFYGRIEPENVVVEYRPIGLGFAGNPYGPDVEPLVTVTITDVEFAPGVLQAFGLDPFDMPPVASSLSGEDLS